MSIRQDSPVEETSGPQTKITEKEQLKKLTQLSFITLATIFPVEKKYSFDDSFSQTSQMAHTHSSSNVW